MTKETRKWDIFISHASEDKKDFVEPLAQRLDGLAVRVWYDKFVLVPGDRLSETIGDGLANCRFGLLVISKAFMKKPWTKYELSGLINRFIEEKTRLIPIWLDITRSEVADFNPALADLFAIDGNQTDINDCAIQILRIVRPQLYDNMIMLFGLENLSISIRESSTTDDISLEGPVRHHDLPESLLVRMQNIWFEWRNLTPQSLDKFILEFQKELRPERELEVMERIIGATKIAMDILRTTDPEIQSELLGLITAISTGATESVFEAAEAGKYDKELVYVAGKAWLNSVPSLTVIDVDDT